MSKKVKIGQIVQMLPRMKAYESNLSRLSEESLAVLRSEVFKLHQEVYKQEDEVDLDEEERSNEDESSQDRESREGEGSSSSGSTSTSNSTSSGGET